MVDVNFYHLTKSTVKQTLPRLVEKILSIEKRGLIVTANKEETEIVNQELWSSTRLFLPHGSSEDGFADRQPIYITHLEENPNGADVLILIGGADSNKITDYEKCLLLFDGNDQAQVTSAREKWKHCQKQGYELIYWKQDEEGKWQKAA